MKRITAIIIVLLLSGFCPQITEAQETISATGGTATGTGGTATYTGGQLVFNVVTGTTGFIIQGVQQPFEISVVTAIANTEDITLECIVYPNPTDGIIRLVIKSFEDGKMRFLLYDLNGILLQEMKIEERETVISLENLLPSVYFLKVIKGNLEVKVFKIIKK